MSSFNKRMAIRTHVAPHTPDSPPLLRGGSQQPQCHHCLVLCLLVLTQVSKLRFLLLDVYHQKVNCETVVQSLKLKTNKQTQKQR